MDSEVSPESLLLKTNFGKNFVSNSLGVNLRSIRLYPVHGYYGSSHCICSVFTVQIFYSIPVSYYTESV
jgi:hypothetical protein